MATTLTKKLKNNPFGALVDDDRPLLKPIEYEKTRPIYNLVPKGQKIVDINGESRDIVVYEPIFIREIDIQAEIDSYADEVGIQNILRKVAMTGDKSYLNQTGREPLNPNGGLEPVQDYSNVPSSKTEAFNAVAAGVAAYDSLPEEIKGKMSFEQFAKEFGQQQYQEFVQALINKYKENNTTTGGDSH